MQPSRKLIIVGDSAFAEIAYEYFTYDSDYEVVAFSVEQGYIKRDSLFGLPIVPFETLHKTHAPADYSVFVAIPYTQLNRLRTRLAYDAKTRGFALASYISSRAFVWRNVELGEHCFIFEDNTLQPFVKVGDNIVMWSGNHIGHHSTIGSNCFISSHVVISGFVNVGENCFLGVNCTISNNVTIDKDVWLGLGVVITKDVPEGAFYKPSRSEVASVLTREYFKLEG